MSGEKKRLSRGDCMLMAMGLLLVAAIIYIALTGGGSAKAIDNAADVMWDYIDEKYPDIDAVNHGEKPEHLGANAYSLLVSDADCSDIYFYVSYTNGNIEDDYYYRVTEMTNTLLRLEGEMGEYFCTLMIASDTDIVRAEVTFSPRVRNDIPNTIYPGVEFDPTFPIYRGSTLTLVCSATEDMNIIAALIGKAHRIAEENGIAFSEYTVYGMESESVHSLEVAGITAEIAESDVLCEVLEAALAGQTDVSGTDAEGVSVKLY